MMIDTWFGVQGEPTLGFLHVPDDGAARGGVVICPPLGHDHINSYRTLRYLGQQYAAAGIAALRFDYLGEGDASGESALPGSAEGWVEAVVKAVEYLRASGVRHVSLLALTSGALVATEALQRLEGVEQLVLWDPVLSGRRFLRRQRTLHDLAIGAASDADPDVVPLLSLTLHARAADWLQGVEITSDSLPAIPTLVLGRAADATNPANRKFTESLSSLTDYVAITEQEAMLDVESAIASIPVETVETIVMWTSARLPSSASPIDPVVTVEAKVGSTVDGSPIIERIGRFGQHDLFTIETVRDGFGVLDEAGVIVMQPAAAEHRVGPGRFQVEAARQLAARGYRAVRFDRRITGDSTEVQPGERSLVLAAEWVDDASELTDALSVGSPLGTVGICSGAWVAARIADRAAARLTVLVDPNYYRTNPLKPDEYAGFVRAEQSGTPSARADLRAKIRDAVPNWLWRLAARRQLFNDPGILLAASSVRSDSTVAVWLTPEDQRTFDDNRGGDAVARLTKRGSDVRVTSYPFGDHALLGLGVRNAMLADLLALVEQTMPSRTASEIPTGAR